jgi:segregation and condensation protein B
MSQEKLKNVLEAAMFAAQRPLTVDDLAALFESSEWTPERKAIREALGDLAEEWRDRGIELKQVASGFRFQVRKEYSASGNGFVCSGTETCPDARSCSGRPVSFSTASI